MKTTKGYTVKITVGDAVVEVEGAESGVVKIVEAISGVLRSGGGVRKSASSADFETTLFRVPGTATSMLTTPVVSRDARDIRSFFEEKAPSSDVEAVAAAAYYYQYLAPEKERRDFVDSVTLSDAFRLARRPLPSKMIYTLQNARNAGYLDSVGVGQYRLNPVGYNLVEHALGPSARAEKPVEKKTRRRSARKEKKPRGKRKSR